MVKIVLKTNCYIYNSKYHYLLLSVSLRVLITGRAMNKCMTAVERVHCQGIDILVVTDREGAALSRSHVTAKFEPSTFARKVSAEVDAEIEKVWTVRCGQNPRLYNGSKFRLGGWRTEGGRWELDLGLTSYKDLCGTNLAQESHHIQNKGLQDFGDRQAYMADPIGVGLLALTSDGCLLVTRRAAWTAEYPSALDRPGGHPEPDHVFQKDGSLKEHWKGRNVDEVVMEEVWWSAVAEAEAEVGLRREHVQELKWMGMDLNMEAGGRPSFEFFARLGVGRDEVMSIYNQGGHAEADENCGLHLIPPYTLARIHHHLPPLPPSPPEQTTGAKKTDQADEKASGAGENEEAEKEEEAAWLVREATPSLKAALILASLHRLLP